jgi:hypothetical protein
VATLLQLSETLTINIDTVTVLRYDDGHWLVFFDDPAHACHLSDEESAVLAHYTQKHTSRISWQVIRHQRGRIVP